MLFREDNLGVKLSKEGEKLRKEYSSFKKINAVPDNIVVGNIKFVIID